MGNYKPTMRHYTTMDSDKYYELLWQNSGFADVLQTHVVSTIACTSHVLSYLNQRHRLLDSLVYNMPIVFSCVIYCNFILFSQIQCHFVTVHACPSFTSYAGSLTLYHMVSIFPLQFFQLNRKPGLDSGNQKKSTPRCFQILGTKSDLGQILKSTFFKSVCFWASIKNTSLKYFVDFCCPAL